MVPLLSRHRGARQEGHHNTLMFSPHQQTQQASGSKQPPSSSGQQLSGSGVNCSTAEGSSDQPDAAPKASQRFKKQPPAAALARRSDSEAGKAKNRLLKLCACQTWLTTSQGNGYKLDRARNCLGEPQACALRIPNVPLYIGFLNVCGSYRV